MTPEIPREECGVAGFFRCPEAAKLAYLSLYALQHRGQESAGIVACDPAGKLRTHKGAGLVNDVFDEEALNRLEGDCAIGHVRYSTTGGSQSVNVQPLLANYHGGQMAIAPNGNLINADELRRDLEAQGAIFQSSTDSEILLHLIAHARPRDFDEALMQSAPLLQGAFSIVMLTGDRMMALRDPRGIRPLVLGRLGDGYMVASESCAMDILGARYERTVQPGELIVFDQDGMHSEWPFERPNGGGGLFQNVPFTSKPDPAQCVFEKIYYSRPDSITTEGRSIYSLRVELGRELARESHVDCDLVIGVPDSAIPSAIGYAREAQLPYELGLIRNHYIGRTFIEPTQNIRDFGAKIKYNPVRDVLEGRRVMVVDDSIVRGTTSRKIIKMLREAGATEVHLRSSAPPWVHPCYYGIDTPSPEELIASHMSVPEMEAAVGADSLRFLSIEGLNRVMPRRFSYCQACFDGNYVAGKPLHFRKCMLEERA